MIEHKQKSTKQKGFWQPTFVGDVLQATIYYWQDLEISIPQTDLSTLNDGDKIYIEDDVDPLHLIEVYAVNNYVPLSGDTSTSPGQVIWKVGGEIHYLYHEDE